MNAQPKAQQAVVAHGLLNSLAVVTGTLHLLLDGPDLTSGETEGLMRKALLQAEGAVGDLLGLMQQQLRGAAQYTTPPFTTGPAATQPGAVVVAHGSEPRFLVLHQLRLRPYATTAQLSMTTGVAADRIRALLRVHRDRGRVRFHRGAISGWVLTDAGRDEHSRLMGAELELANARHEVAAAHRTFLPLNRELLEICTAWQLGGAGSVAGAAAAPRPARPAPLDELERLHRRAVVLLDHLASVLERFAVYPERLSHALRRAMAGDTGWIADPDCDSYHSIWFELHEDLLVTLGRDRVHGVA